MADIFLSYAREDAAQARRLAQALESHGWSVWWDRRIPHGQNFTASIQQQLDDARCIAVLWSKASIASSFVLDEAAEGLGGRLVPLLIEKVKQPLGFRQFQAADLTDWTGETPHDEFGRLLDSITTLVKPHPSAAPAPAAPPASVAVRKAPPASAAVSEAPPLIREADVYVCYSHLDNIELIEGRRGWVHNFTRALDIRLSQLLGRSAAVWMNPKLAGADSLTEKEFDVIRHAACLVAVVSPRFVRSEWVRRELAEFERVAAEQGGTLVGNRSRVFKVLKTPVSRDTLPEELQTLLGYEFFKIEPDSGKVRELDEVFGPEAQRDFWLKLDDLAHDIGSMVEAYREARTS
jgi:hypothetical protein